MPLSKEQIAETIEFFRTDKNEGVLKDFQPPKKHTFLGNYEFSLILTQKHSAPLPDSLKNKFVSFPLFGLTDYQGSFYNYRNYADLKKGGYIQKIELAINDFNATYSMPDLSKIDSGDLYVQFNSGVFRSGVKIHSVSSISYGTILNSLSDNIFLIKKLKIIVPNGNISQFDNDLIFNRYSISGKTKTENFNLRKFVTPDNFSNWVVDIPLNIMLDKNFSIFQQLNWDVPEMQLIFSLTKIKI